MKDIGIDDIGKQLRKIHFFLVVLCVGLLLTLSINETTEIDHAYSQFKSILKLQNNWKEIWESCALEIIQMIELGPKWPGELPSEIYVAPPKDVPFQLKLERCIILRQDEDIFKIGVDGIAKSILIKKPKNLSDFIEVWDSLLNIHSLIVPSTIADEVKISLMADTSVLLFDTHKWTLEKPSIEFPKRWTHTLVLQESLGPDSDKTRWYFFTSGEFYGKDTINFWLEANVKFFEINDVQARIGRRVDESWITGKFERRFRELDKITKQYQRLSFEDIDRILYSEKTRKDERLSLFGASIPVSVLSIWGIPIILAVQLYLLLHVNEFRKRYAKTTKVREVAWIALYDNLWSRIAFSLSGLMLPVVISVLLTVETAKSLDSKNGIYFCVIGSLISMLLAGMTLGEFRQFWKTS